MTQNLYYSVKMNWEFPHSTGFSGGEYHTLIESLPR